jgi:hypothetical protein
MRRILLSCVALSLIAPPLAADSIRTSSLAASTTTPVCTVSAVISGLTTPIASLENGCGLALDHNGNYVPLSGAGATSSTLT